LPLASFGSTSANCSGDTVAACGYGAGGDPSGGGSGFVGQAVMPSALSSNEPTTHVVGNQRMFLSVIIPPGAWWPHER
jgi:hypothetical protein